MQVNSIVFLFIWLFINYQRCTFSFKTFIASSGAYIIAHQDSSLPQAGKFQFLLGFLYISFQGTIHV